MYFYMGFIKKHLWGFGIYDISVIVYLVFFLLTPEGKQTFIVIIIYKLFSNNFA